MPAFVPIIARLLVSGVVGAAGYFGWELAEGQADAILQWSTALVLSFATLAGLFKRKSSKNTHAALCLFVLAGCGASLPVEQLQAAQRQAVEACKVIQQLPPIPDGPSEGGQVEDPGGAEPPADVPGDPEPPVSRGIEQHRKLRARVLPAGIGRPLGEALRGADPARRGTARGQAPS